MKLSIDVFKCLSDIAEQHKITQSEWAVMSGLEQPRIAELKKLYRMKCDKSAAGSMGRAFTLDKCTKLYRGLRKILGEGLMKKEMLECANKELDPTKRLILLVLALEGNVESDILYVEQTMRMIIEKPEK